MHRRFIGIILSVLILLIAARQGHALRPNRKLIAYGLNVFSTEKGLPQSAVMALCQVRRGYIWLGTYEGLARFDGVSFDVFNKSNIPVLRNNSIKCIREDHKNRLWIGTPNGLLVLEDGRFRLITTKDGLSGDFVLSIYQDRRNRIWVGTTQGLNMITGKGAVSFYPGRQSGSNYISAVCEDERGRLWVGTNDGLLTCENPFSEPWQKRLPHDIRVLYCDDEGSLWVGTAGKGLFQFSSHNPDPPQPVKGLNNDDVRVVFRDRHGALWIGTNGGGLIRYFNGKMEFLTIRQGLPGDSVRSILEDHEGSLWVGTRNGMVQLTDDRYTLFNSRNGLPVDEVRCVVPDSSGRVCIGTVGGGIVRFDGGEFQVPSRGGKRGGGRIWSLAGDNDNGIWFGTYGDGLHHLDGRGRLRTWTQQDGLPSDIVRAILVEDKDRVWVGTHGGGVALLQNGQFVRRYNRENGMPSDFVFAISRGWDGELWFGTYDQGLVELKEGRIRVFGSQYGLDSHAIWTIYPDRDHNLWLGTDDGGLKRFYNGHVDVYSIKEGMYSDSAFQIVDDGQGRLWMNCNKGVYNVRIRDLLAFSAGNLSRIPCNAFGKSEGMRVIETSGPAHPAGCLAPDGRLWFPTINGVTVFDREWNSEKDVLPPVAIDQILINRKEYQPSNKILVPPGKGTLEVEYSGFSFRLPESVRFRYRLEGHDDAWTDAGSRRFVAMTNLSPGKYFFRVAAGNAEGQWNPETAGFSFELRPGFFQTWWFFLLLGLLLVGLVLLGYWVNLQQLRRRHKRLANLISERTVQLNNANGRLNDINTQLQDANMKLKYLAHMDGLTQIANHRFFMENLEREWRLAVRQIAPLSLLFVDIDYFKSYNDTHGHQQGDECLKQVAQALARGLVRPRDFVARYGGEEFVAILPGTESQGARVAAEKLRVLVEQLHIPHGGSDVSDWVTISLGVASCIPGRKENPMSLLQSADRALYQAKRNGRNQTIFLPGTPSQ